MLRQTGADILRHVRHGAKAYCRELCHGCIALSGEPAADLNMLFLASGSTRTDFDGGLRAVNDKAVDALLIVEEGAKDIRSWASEAGFNEVGEMPLMERRFAEVRPTRDFDVRIASPGEVDVGNRISAAAFSLDEDACNRALPKAAFAVEGNDLWFAEEGGKAVGCGIFIRTDDHVGIYSMSTLPEHQRRGVGRAILDAAISHYQREGVERFTLGATETGYPLYERLGFEIVTRAHVFVIGASTQFPSME
jgi:ribosomal protein S18 acetylase RimI-like enzyme